MSMVLMFLFSLLFAATAAKGAKDVATASAGFCGPTVDDVGDCDSGNSGSWRIDAPVLDPRPGDISASWMHPSATIRDVTRWTPGAETSNYTRRLEPHTLLKGRRLRGGRLKGAAIKLVHSPEWEQLKTTCRTHCASCSRCRFISYSLHHRDCSWHAVCDLARLQTTGTGKVMDFRTMAMKKNRSSPLRLARGLSRRQTMPTQKWAELSAAAHARPFMVQIGANDHSQDKDGGDIAPRLLQRGWRGLLVEPMSNP